MSALQRAADVISSATKEDNAKNYEEALRLYKQGVEYMLHAIKHEISGAEAKRQAKVKCEAYLKRATQIKEHLNRPADSEGRELPANEGEGDSGSSGERWGSLEVAVKPNVRFDDVVGHEKVKERLKETVVLPVKFPQLFTRRVPSGVLLFGAPGTGKSLLARAAVAEADAAALVRVPVSDLASSRTVGAEKAVRDIFELAKARSPCILLIDEIDLLLSCPPSDDSDRCNRVKTEFLVQLHSLNWKKDGVLVLATTSRPWDLHQRVRRFFERRFHVGMPDLPDRVGLLKQSVGTAPHSLTAGDFEQLGGLTDGYSGADIVNAVKSALVMPVRQLQSATHFKKVSGPSPRDPSVTADDLLMPCNADDEGAIAMSWKDLKEDELKLRDLDASDMKQSLSQAKASVTEDFLQLLAQFKEDFCPDY